MYYLSTCHWNAVGDLTHVCNYGHGSQKRVVCSTAEIEEQHQTFYAAGTTITLYVCRSRERIVAENCCSDGKHVGYVLRLNLHTRAQAALQQHEHGHQPPFLCHSGVQKWMNILMQVSTKLLYYFSRYVPRKT